jgi:hypothetical protein
MIITSLSESGLAEQDNKGRRSAKIANDQVGTAALGCAFAAMQRKDFLSRIRDLS